MNIELTRCCFIDLFGRCSINIFNTKMTTSSKLLLFPLHRFLVFFLSIYERRSISSLMSFGMSVWTYASAISSFFSSRCLVAATFFDFFPSGIRSCALVYSANSENQRISSGHLNLLKGVTYHRHPRLARHLPSQADCQDAVLDSRRLV